MFSQLFTDLEQGVVPDFALLQRRFDLALTKKLAVVKLPPVFWMQDSKINPRADHLLQVALLLTDRERAAMAVSVLAVELAEQKHGLSLDLAVENITMGLLRAVPDDLEEQIVELAAELV
jgi:hypothetical protein